ncbi:hypothetical protein BB934_00525 [Microvirga ossetica]|uniref:Uncharacterized protein n=1 Tax=Microvirga ossetica TaxID=1882682 RepID=A0A1B2EA80_9HYPH|nr:hypothetical protein BB934_00525 [Microvirga ossetica]
MSSLAFRESRWMVLRRFVFQRTPEIGVTKLMSIKLNWPEPLRQIDINNRSVPQRLGTREIIQSL